MKYVINPGSTDHNVDEVTADKDECQNVCQHGKKSPTRDKEIAALPAAIRMEAAQISKDGETAPARVNEQKKNEEQAVQHGIPIETVTKIPSLSSEQPQITVSECFSGKGKVVGLDIQSTDSLTMSEEDDEYKKLIKDMDAEGISTNRIASFEEYQRVNALRNTGVEPKQAADKTVSLQETKTVTENAEAKKLSKTMPHSLSTLTTIDANNGHGEKKTLQAFNASTSLKSSEKSLAASTIGKSEVDDEEDAPQGMHPSSNLDNLADTDNNSININAMSFGGDLFEISVEPETAPLDNVEDYPASHMEHKENLASQLSLNPSVSSFTEHAKTPKTAVTKPAKRIISEGIKSKVEAFEELNVKQKDRVANRVKISAEGLPLSVFDARSIDTTDNDTSSETINTEIAILQKEIEDYRREIEELQNIVDSQRAEISSELDRYQAEADLIEQRIQHAETEILALNEQLVQNERLLAEEKETQADAVAKNLLNIVENKKR